MDLILKIQVDKMDSDKLLFICSDPSYLCLWITHTVRFLRKFIIIEKNDTNWNDCDQTTKLTLQKKKKVKIAKIKPFWIKLILNQISILKLKKNFIVIFQYREHFTSYKLFIKISFYIFKLHSKNNF